jgi:hypothetical protein
MDIDESSTAELLLSSSLGGFSIILCYAGIFFMVPYYKSTHIKHGGFREASFSRASYSKGVIDTYSIKKGKAMLYGQTLRYSLWLSYLAILLASRCSRGDIKLSMEKLCDAYWTLMT